MGLLYTLNHRFLLGLTEFSADKMCTSLPQMWRQPCGARIEPEPVMNCVFANSITVCGPWSASKSHKLEYLT